MAGPLSDERREFARVALGPIMALDGLPSAMSLPAAQSLQVQAQAQPAARSRHEAATADLTVAEPGSTHSNKDRRPSSSGSTARNDGSGPHVTLQDMVIAKESPGADGLAIKKGQCHQPVKVLPRGTRPVRLIGEGAANAVFEFDVPDASGQGDGFRGLLLRVSKVPVLGQTSSFDYQLQHRFVESVIKPLLGKYVVHQELVSLHDCGLVEELNDLLQSIDHLRKDKFRGSYVGLSDYGFLVVDMRPQDAEKSMLIEFKPKWLTQSPSAPENAVRCRQCAIELQHFLLDPKSHKSPPTDRLCPLALNDGAPSEVSSPFRIAPHLADDKDLRQHFENVLRKTINHNALKLLKAQQTQLDHDGPLRAKPSDIHFNLAMTLRDCTCFVELNKLGGGDDGPLRVRFGDFDWKDPKVKFKRWHHAEEDLINGGFYTADWILCDDVLYHPPTLCALEWTPREKEQKSCIINVHNREAPKPDTPLLRSVEKKYTVLHHATNLALLEPTLQKFALKESGSSQVFPPNPHKETPG